MLCGKEKCPVLAKYFSKEKFSPALERNDIAGSSPPSVFIGRYGYPKVAIGPMLPPVLGDTTYLDTPELWQDITIEQLIDFRTQLVRGTHLADVHNLEGGGRIVDATREVALSVNAVDMEALFESKPSGGVKFYSEAQPHGPSAPIERLTLDNPKYEPRIEKAFYDTDLKSRDAVIGLHKDGSLVSRIQKAFSVGAFGEGKNRKFVPTRWSITAVDSMIGEHLMEKTKIAPTIDEYRIYEHIALDNRWIILLMPTEWCFELIEAWYPDTAWNPYDSKIQIFSSYEFYDGRDAYAEIGGCYYASRMAVNELLTSQGKQAGCVIMREAHPGYILPVGVWNVRENVRAALRTQPKKFESLNDAMFYATSNVLDIPAKRWINVSGVLKHRLYQRRVEDFLFTGESKSDRQDVGAKTGVDAEAKEGAGTDAGYEA
ncbi:MAG: hypothetical protein CVT48_02720 [Thermoplasmata archaeon HGW-Thermoplasmata-1]|nr:MAG: hypothetical protein CVT48_02720 [Thermoplasmata archaeon HGW-Thermoplasmata-1]